MSELRYWVWFSMLTNVRPRAKSRLLEAAGSVREVFYADDRQYEQLGFLTPEECRVLAENKDLGAAKRVIAACAEQDVGIITMQDAAYPRRLSEIYDPPMVLYVKGRLPNVDDICSVAVVGTRSATPYGIKMAERMGYGITKCGGLVVSGLTRGVDEAAARGALMAGGTCIGVLGGAIDSVQEGRGLAYDVSVIGAVVSEYPPGTRGNASFYRARNRVTSGLSVATLVVEAPARSGALLFADEALSQGREVFAVPGNADAASSAGTNRLIMEGAHPALSAWDVLSGFTGRFSTLDERGRRRELPEEWETKPQAEEDGASPASEEDISSAQKGETTAQPAAGRRKKSLLGRLRAKKDVDKPEGEEYIDLKKQLEGLSAEQLAIITAITGPHTHVDDIIERTGLAAAQVLGELTMLQIKGYVSQEPGKRFSLNIISQK